MEKRGIQSWVYAALALAVVYPVLGVALPYILRMYYPFFPALGLLIELTAALVLVYVIQISLKARRPIIPFILSLLISSLLGLWIGFFVIIQSQY